MEVIFYIILFFIIMQIADYFDKRWQLYRNYKYGGDDHISVVHTENLTKCASIFITSAIHKSSYTGEFNYGRNFYPKDADKLNISLPTKNQKPDYEIMQTLISAIQKLVIKDVVLYTDKNVGKS